MGGRCGECGNAQCTCSLAMTNDCPCTTAHGRCRFEAGHVGRCESHIEARVMIIADNKSTPLVDSKGGLFAEIADLRAKLEAAEARCAELERERDELEAAMRAWTDNPSVGAWMRITRLLDALAKREGGT